MSLRTTTFLPALSKAVIALAAVAVAGGVGYYVYERNTGQPDYQLLSADGRFELRQYPALLVAETIQTGSRDSALNRGFRELADYIFAKSRSGDEIAMTAPVIQTREKIPMTAPVIQDQAGRESWRTRFIMPPRYSRTTLPKPAEGVTIAEIPPRRVAAVRFSGTADDVALATRESELRRWIAARGLQVLGEPEYAFYNSPFIPPFLRRSEVLIRVAG